MFEVLQTYFEQRFPLTEKDIAIIRSVFLPKQLKKGEFFLRAGEESRYAAFVARGFLRSYVVDKTGREHIVLFAPENWWISDKKGFSPGGLADFFIDAIEDSELLLLDEPGHLLLIEKIPGYASSFQTGMRKHLDAKDKRILHSLLATAEERYNDFMETYPLVAQRVPQHMLASYLGITPETLSRVRRRGVKK